MVLSKGKLFGGIDAEALSGFLSRLLGKGIIVEWVSSHKVTLTIFFVVLRDLDGNSPRVLDLELGPLFSVLILVLYVDVDLRKAVYAR
jgi:hypothetical protein